MICFKLSNCCELLHQFVKYNRLLEATELAQEMLSAMLGAGSSYFSFKHPITVRTAEQLLPVNILDILLECLKANSEIVEYKQVNMMSIERQKCFMVVIQIMYFFRLPVN